MQRRNAGERRLELRFGARAVELGAAARIQARLREAERLSLVFGIADSHIQLFLQAAQHEVVSRDFGGDRDLRITQLRDGYLLVRARCFAAATHAPEKIQFP